MQKRFRLRYTFWLDLMKPEQQAIAETIDELKGRRKFSRAVRDGLRLFVDLSQGKTDVLFELFPQFQNQLGNNEALLARLDQLESKLSNHRPARTNDKPSDRDISTTDKEEDLPAINVREDKSSDSGQNFLNSLFALQN